MNTPTDPHAGQAVAADPAPRAPAAYASHPLFAPIAPLLARFTDARLPDAATLSALLAETAGAVTSGGGQPVRFVPPPDEAPAYEAHIHARGEVPTRIDDWHDFFNALAWCAWPRTKAACNALHLREIAARRAAGASGRGARRDALTQFDECGIVVVSADPSILALLAAHEWEAVFWQRRDALAASTRFMVFGHGSWDQLRAPFFGLCAKAVHRVVDAGWLALPEAARQAETDAWLAAWLKATFDTLTPRTLRPLPLLGIPGVTPANACAAYYRDTRQFRPRRGAVRG